MKSKARCFGQDLMRGEHTVGGGMKGNTSASAAAMKYAGFDESGAAGHSGTSIFDPVLCELAYRWFSPIGGTVLDPFAGGSVRGIVASKLGRQYVGIELRAEQVEANRAQADEICKDQDPVPVWHVGDSGRIDFICNDLSADFVFSCPPYGDLEVYSDDPADLSNMPFDDFAATYKTIITKSCALLKPDRFACFVIGDIRDKGGMYRNLPSLTIDAFSAAGLRLYNEAILVTTVGSLPIRVGRQFESGRKLGKAHQNVLIFIKGDPKIATAACGPVDVAGFDEIENQDFNSPIKEDEQEEGRSTAI